MTQKLLHSKQWSKRAALRPRRAAPSSGARRPDSGGDHVTPDRILELGYAFWKSKAVLSAVELGLFTVLGSGPLDGKALAARLKLNRRGAADFFDALVALGLLTRHPNGRYANAPDAATYLDRNQPLYVGALLQHMNARHYQNWSGLTQALRTGTPQSILGNGSYPALYDDTATRDIFLDGMSAGSLLAAKALANKFPWRDFGTVIDVGTAQGCVPVEIARLHDQSLPNSSRTTKMTIVPRVVRVPAPG
jgi:Dimerisation domain